MYLYMLSDVYVYLGEKTSMENNIWRHELNSTPLCKGQVKLYPAVQRLGNTNNKVIHLSFLGISIPS